MLKILIFYFCLLSSDRFFLSLFRERERKRFDGKVLKAIRTLNDGNGADIDEICDYLLVNRTISLSNHFVSIIATWFAYSSILFIISLKKKKDLFLWLINRRGVII